MAQTPSNLHNLLPAELMRISNNYNHLFEQPTLFYAVALAPSLNHTLRDYWAAAERGDTAVALDLRDRFRNDHRRAELILQVNLLLVLGGLAASAVALGPDPKPTGGLPAPALLQQR